MCWTMKVGAFQTDWYVGTHLAHHAGDDVWKNSHKSGIGENRFDAQDIKVYLFHHGASVHVIDHVDGVQSQRQMRM